MKTHKTIKTASAPETRIDTELKERGYIKRAAYREEQITKALKGQLDRHETALLLSEVIAQLDELRAACKAAIALWDKQTRIVAGEEAIRAAIAKA